MKLRFTHWRTGPTDREVERLRGTVNLYHDETNIYRLGPVNERVYLAGSWNNGRPVFNELVALGDNGLTIELRNTRYQHVADQEPEALPCHTALGSMSTPVDGETARAVFRPTRFDRDALDYGGDWA